MLLVLSHSSWLMAAGMHALLPNGVVIPHPPLIPQQLQNKTKRKSLLSCGAQAQHYYSQAGLTSVPAPVRYPDRNGLFPLLVFHTCCDQHLQSACNLRVRTFYDFNKVYSPQDHIQYLSGIEYEALKEKINGTTGYGNVFCVIATIPISSIHDISDDLLSLCKVTVKINDTFEEQLLVGSLDLNQTPKLPDEISGDRPLNNVSQLRRAYLSNVCVAEELQKKGVGSNLIDYAKQLAISRGISDLYTHVAIGNESAERLYQKSGFVKEKAEKAAEARLIGRPQRLLLWMQLN